METEVEMNSPVDGSAERTKLGAAVLGEMLGRSRDGAVSTQVLRKELEARGVADPIELIGRLKAIELGEGALERGPRWYHLGRSFLTEAKYREAQQAQAAEAAQSAAADGASDLGESGDELSEEDGEAIPPRERKKRRHEEARLGAYILPVLEEIYDDASSPEVYVFDVHSLRAGSDFENVDLLAIHWRSPKVIDVVTVEVKLKFTSSLVQQARNYARFSDRVWIALPVLATQGGAAALELRAQNQLLFEHVVEVGLGILGCHRGRGGAYDVFPIHWPRRNQVDLREREEFVDRYRPQFEESGVIPPLARSYPKI